MTKTLAVCYKHIEVETAKMIKDKIGAGLEYRRRGHPFPGTQRNEVGARGDAPRQNATKERHLEPKTDVGDKVRYGMTRKTGCTVWNKYASER
ncbi:hypothetical protein PM082_011473 [Marasmius tenuissimus]|nr:hypothetical protein PM082_011473 [Marasmius tenuissimus]